MFYKLEAWKVHLAPIPSTGTTIQNSFLKTDMQVNVKARATTIPLSEFCIWELKFHQALLTSFTAFSA